MAAKGKPKWPVFGDTVPAAKQLLKAYLSVVLSNASAAVVTLLEGLSAAASFVFATFFSIAMTHFSWQAYVIGERSLARSTPLWIPKALVAFGATRLALQLLVRLRQLSLG